MNDEIKEILKEIECYRNEELCLIFLSREESNALLDYIANLQQENKRLKENNQSMQEEMARIWEENEKMSKRFRNCKKITDDYKSRCEKAIEYINKNKHLSMFADCREPEEEWYYDLECSANDLLNILQNGSDKN